MEILSQHANRLLTRAALLDALSGTGSDSSDRVVDFLINRLRRKLADDVRNPRYIATRYGEGYVWIAPAISIADEIARADLVVGPVHGLDQLGGFRPLAEEFADQICRTLRTDLLPDQTVAYAPTCPPAPAFSEISPSRCMQLIFFLEGNALHCVATMREFRTSRVLAARRDVIHCGGPEDRPVRDRTRDLARDLLNQAWRSMATSPEADGPLALSMFNAAIVRPVDQGSPTDGTRRLFRILEGHEARNLAAWKQTDRRLLDLRAADPGDAGLKMLQAINLHTKYVTNGYRLFTEGKDNRREDEDMIESLVLEALPYVRGEPEHVIMGAKLLHFLNRGYAELARELAEDAYQRSTSVSGSLVVIGQLRAFSGEMDAALRCIDQALNLVQPGSDAHRYALVVKCQVLMAASEHEQLKEAKRELYGLSPVGALFFEPLFSDPRNLSIRARAATLALSRSRAAGLLLFNHYVSARQFRDATHRENLTRTPLMLCVRRFGADVVPDEVSKAYPGLVARLR